MSSNISSNAAQPLSLDSAAHKAPMMRKRVKTSAKGPEYLKKNAFEKFPEELLTHIFTFLSPPDIYKNASLVAKNFHCTAGHFRTGNYTKSYWKHHLKTRFPQAYESLKEGVSTPLFELYRQQSIIYKNFLQKNFHPPREDFYHNNNNDLSTLNAILQSNGFVASVNSTSIMVWDFNTPDPNNSKKEFKTDENISAIAFKHHKICAFAMHQIFVWDIRTPDKDPIFIRNIPQGLQLAHLTIHKDYLCLDFVELAPRTSFYKCFLIDFKALTGSIDFNKVASCLDNVKEVLKISKDRVVCINIESVMVYNLKDSLTVPECVFKAEKLFTGAVYHKKKVLAFEIRNEIIELCVIDLKNGTRNYPEPILGLPNYADLDIFNDHIYFRRIQGELTLTININTLKEISFRPKPVGEVLNDDVPQLINGIMHFSKLSVDLKTARNIDWISRIQCPHNELDPKPNLITWVGTKAILGFGCSLDNSGVISVFDFEQKTPT